MKKIIRQIALGVSFALLGSVAHSQNGLNAIVVEKYYVSNANDAAFSSGVLPAGSVTYRIYADMRSGYKFEAAYGNGTHTLTMRTTTKFFNDETNGATTPDGITKASDAAAATMLDSWVSAGAAAKLNSGVLKTDDNGVGTVVNNTPGAPGGKILQNNNVQAGIPLTTQDGMITVTPQTTTVVGTIDLTAIDATSQFGSVVTSTNGAWSALNGSQSPQYPANNRVLIAQMTTDGTFHFDLNIQVGDSVGGTQKFVVSNPAAGEIVIPSLSQTFAPNVPPTVSIIAPLNGANFITGSIVHDTATAADVDGTVDSVAFFVNGVRIGVDVTSPYSINWTSTVGTKTLTAIAYDNSGAQTTSAPVTINVANNVPPTVSIFSPSGGSTFNAPAVVPVQANATDFDGTVDSVAFYINNARVGVATGSGPTYSYNWTSVIGTANLVAKAYDNSGAVTSSATVTIVILDPNALAYQIGTIVNNCGLSAFCLPVNAVNSVKNVIGYDMVLHYDKNRVTPTGVITVNSALINPAYVTASNSVNAAAGTMTISLYFNSNAPSNTSFNGTGTLFCVGFTKAAMAASDSAAFSITNLQESYFTGVTPKLADPGKYISFRDTSEDGSITFWSGNGPLKYDSGSPLLYLATNIYGNNASCSSKSIIAVHTDTTGEFNYNVVNGQNITIERDILGTTSVQPVINGADALMVRQMLLGTLTPSIYQAIAMDVNMDGVISAGDLSQINQRSVLLIPEFKQAWNYDSAGNSNGKPSRDWQFIDVNTVSINAAYHISSIFPADDGVGFSKSRVPVVPSCLPLQVAAPTACPVINFYKGILIGDINGNFSTVGSSGVFRTSDDRVIFDLSNAVNTDGYVDVPVSVSSTSDVNALDFAMQFNENNLTFNSMINRSANLQALSNFNTNDRTLRFTSNSIQNFDQTQSPVSVRFTAVNGQISEADITSAEAYLNGERVPVEFNRNAIQNMAAEKMVSIYPNPASDIINVTVAEDATIQILDAAGRLVLVQTNVNANEKKVIPTQNLANGIYMMKIYNNSFVTVKKVVINK